MGETAKKVLAVSEYNNAGTVEFLLDRNKKFYFLEVNARLQVEHPVTELTTGVDLVQQQIRIAAGEKLSLKQEDLAQRGHAIECRIYAEDPSHNFLPSSGKILYLREPDGPGVRHDGGIYSGWEVPIYYDPILAKLIVWAETRDSACARMAAALDDYVILGISTTIPFLKEVISHPRFRDGETTTGFIKNHFENWQENEGPADGLTLALAAAALDELSPSRNIEKAAGLKKEVYSPWQTLGRWRIGEKP
jgi:acetyl-CoA carboxylase biotin carboxylase subunit